MAALLLVKGVAQPCSIVEGKPIKLKTVCGRLSEWPYPYPATLDLRRVRKDKTEELGTIVQADREFNFGPVQPGLYRLHVRPSNGMDVLLKVTKAQADLKCKRPLVLRVNLSCGGSAILERSSK
jgi:hypothetical protein